MWKKVHKKFYPKLLTDAVWQAWIDINQWHRWHDDLDYCKLEGQFGLGQHFILKPKGALSVKIKITNVDQGRSFTDCTNFPGAKMWDTHTVEVSQDGVIITNELVVKGPLKWLWIFLVARKVANSVPQETDALVDYIQKERIA